MKRLVILPTFFKSFLYLGNWNTTNMQGTGFIWLLKDFFKHNETPLPKDMQLNKLYYFTTNPYFITFILGILLKESRLHGSIGNLDKVYASAFAALGDTFFFHSLRPFIFFLSVILVMYDPFIAAIVYFLLFNIINIVTKLAGFYIGYHMGGNIMAFFNRIGFNNWSYVLDTVTIFVASLCLAKVFKNIYALSNINELVPIFLLLLGYLLSKWVRGPIELVFVSCMIGILLIFGL